MIPKFFVWHVTNLMPVVWLKRGTRDLVMGCQTFAMNSVWQLIRNKHYCNQSRGGEGLSFGNLEIVLTFHFHKKARTTIGLVSTLQLTWWCYIEAEQTFLERNCLNETPSLRGLFVKWLRENAYNSSQLSNWMISQCYLKNYVSSLSTETVYV